MDLDKALIEEQKTKVLGMSLRLYKREVMKGHAAK
jgi:hypothetical protein